MATLALKPAFPVRTRSSDSKRPRRKKGARDVLQTGPWHTVAITAGAIALAFFCVSAPMIGDPVGRLFALDTMPTIPSEEAGRSEAWSAQAFEFTPTMLGPAITEDMLALAEEDWWVLMMPELEVHALPPLDAVDTPPG
jgi:hypothetical protein